MGGFWLMSQHVWLLRAGSCEKSCQQETYDAAGNLDRWGRERWPHNLSYRHRADEVPNAPKVTAV